MSEVKFGFCAPIFANPGMAFFRTPNYKKLGWEDIKEITLYCEKLGLDSVFIADHVFLGNNGDIWECISLMSALGALTSKMEIIPIHLCNNFRTPSLVAKTFSTISHITNGRVTLFYDYGWRKAEFDSYGISFCNSDEERISQMDEGIQVIKGMLSQENFSFEGDFYQVKNAICTPLPVNKIPVWMGETNNPKMVESIVKNADVFNSMPCSPEDLKNKISVLHEECIKQKRNHDSIGISFETQILIRETEEEIDDIFNHFKTLSSFNNSKDDDILKQLKATNPEMEGYNSKEDYQDQFVIGTPEQVITKLNQYIDVGVNHFMLWFMDYPDKTSIDLFTQKVRPFLKK